ncbi:MAG: hypothetical protein WCH99_22500, partial [Verrucomicrobiota bacterium]
AVRLLSVALHEKAEAPALLHGRRLQREPCEAGWSWADAMRATERNAEAEKAGPENGGKLPLAIGQGSDRLTKNHHPTYRVKRAN